jgi:transcriptional regulator with XRE-family HTH domain
VALPEKLKYYRKKQNLSQEAVAEGLKLSRQAISKWENGHTTPDLENLVRLSAMYEVSIDDLLQEEQEQNLSQENDDVLDGSVEKEEQRMILQEETPDNATENGFSLLLLAILSIVVYPIGFLLIPFVLWQNNQSNSFYKLIYITCLFSILLNIHSTYAHLTDIFNWGVTMIEQIE